ncbi:GNAT family N-acetyltransferase [Catenibacillus scindens]|uniref:GNAT family N-acetyltransferase n=1 Tax=Catenibacillus scindens TaxID=673271 RepID=UPI0032096A99
MPDIHSISYREITYRDSRDLTDFIDRLQNPKNAPLYPQKRLLHHLYLMDSFCGCSYAKGAYVGQKLIGLILGRCQGQRTVHLHAAAQKKLLVLRLLASRLGRSYYNAYRLFNRADRWLLQTCPESFQGELIFMAVDPRFRHQGVALSLLGSFHAYMLSMGVGQICLFTDSACAVSFYDRQRFERLSTLYWPEKSRPQAFAFYLYKFSYF